MSHIVADAKALIVKVRKELKTNQDGCLGKCEKMMSDLVECVEYLSNPGGHPGPKDELSKALVDLRSQVWKINDQLNSPEKLQGQKRVNVASLTKARNRALAAIDKMEGLLNTRKC